MGIKGFNVTSEVGRAGRKPKYFKAAYFAMIISLGLVPAGCVSKLSYDRDIAYYTVQLQQERSDNAVRIKTLEAKLRDKGNTVNELTERYMALQKDRADLQVWQGKFKPELEALSKEISELKLVITTNADRLKGPVANEMLGKIADMENRVNELLRKKGYETQTP